MNNRRDEPDLAAAALAAALESSLAAASAADALGMDRFARLWGKRIRFGCDKPAFTHTWIIEPNGIIIASVDDGPVDLTVRAPFTTLLALLADPDLAADGDAVVSGDEALLEALRVALAGLRPDLGLLLEPLIGARAAAGVDATAAAGVRAAGELAGYVGERLRSVSPADAGGDFAARVASGLGRLLKRLREAPDRP